MTRPVRRYKVRILEDEVTIVTQSQTTRGGYYGVGNGALSLKGLAQAARHAALEAKMLELATDDDVWQL